MNSLIKLRDINKLYLSGITTQRGLASIRNWFGGKKDKGQGEQPESSVIDTLEKREVVSSDYEAIKQTE